MRTPQILDCNIGPYVSDGKFQKSVPRPHTCVPKTKAGKAAQNHDHLYATAKDNVDRIHADKQFYEDLYGTSISNTALAVGVRYFNLHNYGKQASEIWGSPGLIKTQEGGIKRPKENKMPQRLRRVQSTKLKKTLINNNKNLNNAKATKVVVLQATQSSKQPKQRAISTRSGFNVLAAPASIGSALRGSIPTISKVGNGTRVVARDLVSVLSATASSDMELVACVELNPCYFSNAYMTNFAKMYSKFQFNAVTAHFVTDLPTSQQGTVILTYRQNINDPHYRWTTNTFYQKVMTTPGSQIGSMWVNHSMTPKLDRSIKDVDLKTSLDPNDGSSGAIFVYMKYDGVAVPGYIVLDYDITFTQMAQQARISHIPYPQGNWLKHNYNDDVLPAAGVQVTIDCSTIPGLKEGSVWKLILDVSKYVFEGGATATTFFKRETFSTITASILPETIADGFTCYARAYTGHFLLYPTYKSAISTAERSDCLVYGANFAVRTTHAFWSLCLTTGYQDEQADL